MTCEPPRSTATFRRGKTRERRDPLSQALPQEAPPPREALPLLAVEAPVPENSRRQTQTLARRSPPLSQQVRLTNQPARHPTRPLSVPKTLQPHTPPQPVSPPWATLTNPLIHNLHSLPLIFPTDPILTGSPPIFIHRPICTGCLLHRGGIPRPRGPGAGFGLPGGWAGTCLADGAVRPCERPEEAIGGPGGERVRAGSDRGSSWLSRGLSI